MIKERGQLSLGLAFAFTTIIAFLGLVLRSGLVTREKMKLQQTSDIASLTAANVQMQALNKIQEVNRMIDDDFKSTQRTLLARSMPCETEVLPIFAGDCTQVARYTQPYIHERVENEVNVGEFPSIGPCNTGCQGYDAHVRNDIINGFKRRTADRNGYVLNLLKTLNIDLWDKAILPTYLTPENLPLSLNQEMRRRYGENLSMELLKTKYNQKEMEGLFKVQPLHPADSDLFHTEFEFRAFEYPKASYVQLPTPNCTCHMAFPLSPSGVHLTGKMVSNDSYTPRYITGASYTPPEGDRMEKMHLFVRNSHWDTKDFRKRIKDADHKDIRLFGRRSTLQVLSLARPYGGSLPKADRSPLGPARGGRVGNPYAGSKLVGIADRSQVEEINPELVDYQYEIQDENHHVIRTEHSTREDFLH